MNNNHYNNNLILNWNGMTNDYQLSFYLLLNFNDLFIESYV